jgi:hypothetical protein
MGVSGNRYLDFQIKKSFPCKKLEEKSLENKRKIFIIKVA